MDLLCTIQNNPCKYLIVAIIIMIIVFVVGLYCINTTISAINDRNLEYVEFGVTNKYISEEIDHHYVIVDDTNQTYVISNDDYGRSIYDDVQIGSRYHFIIQLPNEYSDNINIVQVYNDTN